MYLYLNLKYYRIGIFEFNKSIQFQNYCIILNILSSIKNYLFQWQSCIKIGFLNPTIQKEFSYRNIRNMSYCRLQSPFYTIKDTTKRSTQNSTLIKFMHVRTNILKKCYKNYFFFLLSWPTISPQTLHPSDT